MSVSVLGCEFWFLRACGVQLGGGGRGAEQGGIIGGVGGVGGQVRQSVWQGDGQAGGVAVVGEGQAQALAGFGGGNNRGQQAPAQALGFDLRQRLPMFYSYSDDLFRDLAACDRTFRAPGTMFTGNSREDMQCIFAPRDDAAMLAADGLAHGRYTNFRNLNMDYFCFDLELAKALLPQF